MDDKKRKKIIDSWIRTFRNNDKKYFEELKKKSIKELEKIKDSYFFSNDVCFGNILDEILNKYKIIKINKIDKIIKEKSK